FALGALFVLVTLFLPRGIVGTVEDLWAKRKARPPADVDPTPAPAE
ncbi:MAG: urea ABC transporter permease subunit UrtC, partial [Phyllobacteriaceae bacterium]|nr:urea ABC transporter permease subunit UrtC [Phyllobacteriaceae bacterium]